MPSLSFFVAVFCIFRPGFSMSEPEAPLSGRPSPAIAQQSIPPADSPSDFASLSESDPSSSLKRHPDTRWSWTRGLSAHSPGVDVLRSPVGRRLLNHSSQYRAGSIISATAVAFADAWRAGVNSKWYATRGWGWRHPENWKTRQYICMYGMDGRPCGPSASWSSMWPGRIHCWGNQCCSRSHVALYFGQPLCTSIDILCSINHDEYSKGKCRCSQNSCGGDTECVEEYFEHGGAYCRCKKGFVGDGKECYEDLCTKMNCSPGKCVQKQNEAHCDCPKGYEEVEQSCKVVPVCNRHVKDLCGPPERVLDCVNIGRTDYTCVCAPGYAVVSTPSGKICDLASNTLHCSDAACGTEGVKECKDMPKGGVTCTCRDGYLLEKQEDGLKFRCSPIDPCKATPCGSETVAKSCTRTVKGSYYCECQPTAELVPATDTQGPYCRQLEDEVAILPYVAVAGGGLILLAMGVGVWYFSFKSGSGAPQEYDYTAQAFTSPNAQL